MALNSQQQRDNGGDWVYTAGLGVLALALFVSFFSCAILFPSYSFHRSTGISLPVVILAYCSILVAASSIPYCISKFRKRRRSRKQ